MGSIKVLAGGRKRKPTIVCVSDLVNEIKRVSGKELSLEAARMRVYRNEPTAIRCHTEIMKRELAKQEQEAEELRENKALRVRVLASIENVGKRSNTVSRINVEK